MCQPMWTRVGISFQGQVDSGLNKTRPVALRIWSCFVFSEQNQNIELNSSTLQVFGRKLTVSVLTDFFSHCNTVSEAVRCFYHFCPCQEGRPSLSEEYNKSGTKKTELDELSRSYIQKKRLHCHCIDGA